MATTITDTIELLNWQEAKPLFANDKKLVAIIDEISPGDALPLIKVRYPYGSVIIENGLLQIPVSETETVPLCNNQVNSTIQNLLGYCAIPFGGITRNKAETFREIAEKVFPLWVRDNNHGIHIGAIESFGSSSAYTMTAGARSLYMIPRITKTASHKKLQRKYRISSPPPKRMIDHWQIFRELYQSEAFQTDWDCEVVFLTSHWDQQRLKSDDKGWLKLNNYLAEKAWQHSELGRRKMILDIVWQQASGLLSVKGIKPDPYVIDTLKHLIYISLGEVSGYRPAVGNLVGPINELQQLYMEVYGLKDHIPTIMRPYSFLPGGGRPVYYSMQTPTMLSSTPIFRTMSSTIEDMRELISLKPYVFDVDYGNLRIDDTAFNDLLNGIDFQYYHGENYAYGNTIHSTKTLPEEDADFLACGAEVGERTFADSGSFVRGCVKISNR